MRYNIVKIFFPLHGQDIGKDVTTELTSGRIAESFDTLSEKIIVHKIVDPHYGKRKDLVIIVKNNTTDDIQLYRFPESTEGNYVVDIVIH
ncbi:hypothetical protein HYN59_15155 [Flavobacterium album]|uniref:Uncharacterized protein n=1 Tax=Flavobacterium album TaxID=2175091 RepID=A0A2S1R150_9FLAO|nr:hypothetical protein [Flavobacterium album]AWH86364.1 hypothetical protein HYN59_15155 [Flavobacterium album]